MQYIPHCYKNAYYSATTVSVILTNLQQPTFSHSRPSSSSFSVLSKCSLDVGFQVGMDGTELWTLLHKLLTSNKYIIFYIFFNLSLVLLVLAYLPPNIQLLSVLTDEGLGPWAE